jgi:tetratricopeptide (TPR) repeat protein
LRQARIDAARGLIEESLALRLRAFGDPSREAAESLVALGGIARDRGEPEQAEAHFRRALAMIDATGADPWQRARLVNNLAVTAGDRGDLEGAEARFREALALMREVLGDEHPTLAAAYGNVASMLSRRGDFVAAGPLLERALALREKHLGAGHPMTGTSLANLGYNDYARGDFAAARTRLERALAIQRQGFGPSHLHTLSTLRNLVMVRLAQGAPAAALAFADELLASDPTSIGVEHPLRLQALLRREVLRCLGERCDARALNDALERQRAKQGANHPEVLESSALAALALRRAGDADGACREAGRAHAALQDMVSETHWDRALAAWTLSGCAGADAAAAARGRALLVARLGADHPLLAPPAAPR